MVSTRRTSTDEELTQAAGDVDKRARTTADKGLSREIAAQRLTMRLSRCLSVDLEVAKKTGRIHAFAGVRPDIGESAVFPLAGRSLEQALAELDDLAEGADFLLGHNLIKFDLPHLQAASPDLSLLRLPRVDTLWLNPLAFPRNPYHHLVKHYQDGQLKRERLNDPEQDARLALQAFSSQQEELLDAPSDLLSAWHWLAGGPSGPGFDLFFESLRRSPRPSDIEAREAIFGRLEGNACR